MQILKYMKTWILFCMLLPYPLFSQQLPKDSQEWLDDNLKAKDVDSKELLADFIKYDFGSVWLTKQDATIGFIGDTYQRFYIHFYEIVKSDTTPACYLVKGKSRVGSNICDFEGVFKILHIRVINKERRDEMLKTAKESNDPELMERAKHEQLIVLAEYVLKENQNMKWSGSFKGTLKSFFYIENGSILYNNSDFEYRDSYSNNVFVGIWKSYKNSAERKCCWGNYRIPQSGDLDVGAGEFSPNGKYLKNGWENYYKAYIKRNKDARKEEEIKWW